MNNENNNSLLQHICKQTISKTRDLLGPWGSWALVELPSLTTAELFTFTFLIPRPDLCTSVGNLNKGVPRLKQSPAFKLSYWWTRNQLHSALRTLGQTWLPFGDVVDALNSKGSRLIHQQDGVSVQLDLQHSSLHPHQWDQQRATPTRPDNIRIPAVGCPPVPRRPQLSRQHFNGHRAFPLSGCLLSLAHYRLLLSPQPEKLFITRVPPNILMPEEVGVFFRQQKIQFRSRLLQSKSTSSGSEHQPYYCIHYFYFTIGRSAGPYT